jgi:aerobic carbon-monoxide dehydrogenase medium subunit
VKPAAFAYERPASLQGALRVLADARGEARPLAGGQSLAPMLHMRLVRPAALVDLNRVGELEGVSAAGSATVVGAMTRYTAIERSPLLSERVPLLQQAMRWVGDRQVRNRGTIGGSLAHADPTAEVPLVCLALGATVVLRSVDRSRELPVQALLLGPYTTAIEAGELLTEVRFPAGPASCALSEVGRRHNDFAVAGVAVTGTQRPTGTWTGLRIAVSGIDDQPVLATTAGALLEGTRLQDEAIDAAVSATMQAADPPDDVRASAEYRAHLAEQQLRRVLVRLRDERADLHG